jgi:hypothetical protein
MISEPNSFMKMLPRLLYVEMLKGAGGCLLMVVSNLCPRCTATDGWEREE